MGNEFLDKMKRLESLKPEYDRSSEIVQTYAQFRGTGEKIKDFLPGVVDRQNLSLTLTNVGESFTTILIEANRVVTEYTELEQELNWDNLRHVVYHLIESEGLTHKQFAEKIGCTEKDIKIVINDGDVSLRLLDKICDYFKIKKTPSFLTYVSSY